MHPQSLQELLSKGIACQKRTSKHKQFVVSLNDKIYKGPFSRETIEKIIQRYTRLNEWKTPFISHPEEVIIIEDGYFIVFEDLSKDKSGAIEKHKESFSEFEYYIRERRGLIKVSDIVKTKAGDWVYSQGKDLFLAFLDLFLLNIGDTGLYNVLADVEKNELYIIDIDETRGSDSSGEFFFLSKAPAKNVREKWGPIIMQSLDEALQHLEEIQHDRIIIAKNKILELKKISDVENVSRSISTMNICPEGHSTQINSNISLNATTTATTPNFINMKYSGRLRGTTISGYSIDEIKSGLQKYIRRGNMMKALQCGVEMYRFAELSEGTPVQSNMYNRLAISAAEDIGPADFEICLAIIDTVNKLSTRDSNVLFAMIQMMCTAKKTRLMSHIWRVYNTPEGRELAKMKGIPLDEEYDEEEFKNARVPENIKDEARELVAPLTMMNLKLQNKDYNCFYWANIFLLEAKDKKVAPRNRRTKAEVLVWEVLRGYLNNEIINILMKAFFEHTENRPFLSTALLAALVGFKEIKPYDLSKLSLEWKGYELETQLLRGEYKLELDDFVFDKHTVKGRGKGKGRQEFVTEGARIENENMDFHIKEFEEIYLVN